MAKLKTIDIKGKEYVQVHTRILEFHKLYKNGAIKTKYEKIDDMWIVKAFAYPDVDNKNRVFTGHAQEIEGSSFINKTSALENAETSAVGRALGMLGIGIDTGMASADEIHKAHNRTKYNEKVDSITRIFIKSKHSEKDKIKALGSAKWDPGTKTWSVPDTETNRRKLLSIDYETISDEKGEVIDLLDKLETVPTPTPPAFSSSQSFVEDVINNDAPPYPEF